MSLPIKPVFEGESGEFMRLMTTFAATLDDIFTRVRNLRLDRAYGGLKTIRFVETLERGGATICYYDEGRDTVSVYPMAFAVGQRVDLALYAALGRRYWHNSVPSNMRVQWQRKLVMSDPAVVDRLSAILQSGKYHSYSDMLAPFHTASERLQVIHILNALIKNSISPVQARLINIKEYPPTSDFCTQRRPFSITPLLSVYCGLADLRQYDLAFAQYCARSGRFPVNEVSVEAELVELFETVTFQDQRR